MFPFSDSSMSSKSLTSFTREEVSQHTKVDDCWIIIENKVYDVTKWLPKHPGGSMMILNLAGNDCTEEYKVFHLYPSYTRLKPFLIGEVVKQEIKVESELSKDVAHLLQQLKIKGAFKPDCKYKFSITTKIIVFLSNFNYFLCNCEFKYQNCVNYYRYCRRTEIWCIIEDTITFVLLLI